MTTKDKSYIQEKMIANYLGWDVVSGSGARPHHPGDIKSDEWLGECKTHMKEVSIIHFDFRVYNKLMNEAMSQMRKPVLFVDNGVSDSRNTYVLTQTHYLPKRYESVDSRFIKHTPSGNLSLNLKNATYMLYGDYHWSDIGKITFMTLDAFKSILDI